MKNKFFVFDVESVGLPGEGFAVGFVVIDEEGNQLDCGSYACPFRAAQGNPEGFKWCDENIPKSILVTHEAPWLVRAAFARKWTEWNRPECVMVADCPWPVEARFLHAMIADDPIGREWLGPYPLLDLGSILFANGVNPTETFERLESECPKHDPLCDARQSARLLLKALRKGFAEPVKNA